jgi:hypothetical protein
MSTKKMFEKILALSCISGIVMFTNVPLVSAFEAHVMNVTANIKDDSITVSPSGENFCNDGKLKVELKSALAGASIYYTTDGTEPVCGKNGTLYTTPFSMTTSKTVKVVSCHDGIQSLSMVRNFNVKDEYCDKTSIKINKIFYNVDKAHMEGTCPNENEWVELYNPTKDAISIKNWKICDGQTCDIISAKDLSIPSKGYAVITDKENTWQFWNIPDDVIKIALGNEIGDGLTNVADMLEIKDSSGKIIDQANWGTPNPSWANYNSGVWKNGYGMATEGSVMGRIYNGYDTDSINDWTIFSLPKVTVDYPNGGETLSIGKTYTIKWTATNGGGSKNTSFSIDIYYSKDSGKTWGIVVKNTENDGAYEWRVPLVLKTNDGANYNVGSDKARIKVVATDYAKNFMLSNWDISDNDFCPPIDKSLLTPEENELLKTMDTTGMKIIDSGSKKTEVEKTADIPASGTNNDTNKNSADTGSQTKSSEMINKDDKDYSLSENQEKDNGDKNGNTETGKNDSASSAASIAIGNAQTSDPSNAVNSQTVNDNINNSQIKTENGSLANDSTSKEQNINSGISKESLPIAPDNESTIEFNLNS